MTLNQEILIGFCERLSERFEKEVVVIKTQSLGGGCINNALRLETNVGVFFAKWNAGSEKDVFLREAEGLAALKKASRGSLLVPEVYAAKGVDRLPGFLITEYFTPEGKNNSEQLGRGLATIHRYYSDDFGFNANNYCGATPQLNTPKTNWLDFYRDNRLYYLLQLIEQNRPMQTEQRKLFDQLLNRLDVLIPNDKKASLIHGDLWSGNYMMSAEGAALIDPACSYSDREMEFGIITMFGGFSSVFFEAYNEVYPLDPEWKSRNDLYQLYHILNHYLLFGGGYLQQAIYVVKSYL